jgi:hypothetical protein
MDKENTRAQNGLDAFYIGKPKKAASVLEKRVANSPRMTVAEEDYNPIEAEAEFKKRLENAPKNTDYVPSYPIRTANKLYGVAISAADEIEERTQLEKRRDEILRRQEEEEIGKTWKTTYRAGGKTQKRRKHKRTTQKRKKARKTKRSKR